MVLRLLAAVSLALAAPVGAEEVLEPVRTPFLMINTEMHVGPITHVATDANAMVVATGSVDKSIRLFEAGNGRLLRKYFLPLGEDLIGIVSGLALSPDGRRMLAATVSFDTGSDFDEGSLYLIDTAGGDLLGRVKQLPGAPIQIAFAPDGSRFAMAYGAGGLELRDAQGKRLHQDRSRPVAALAISDELLVTISDEAEVRVLDLRQPDSEPLRTWRLKDAGQPFSLALAPDGERLAIGYGDRPFVDVVELTGKGRVRLTLPEAKFTTGNLAFVAWTQTDMPWLVAGGTIQTQGLENVLVAWRDGSTGAPATLAVSGDAVTALVPAGGAGIAYATADPSWGRVDVAGDGSLERVGGRSGERLDFRELSARRFEISRDGQSVVFGDRNPERAPLRFDLEALALTANPPAAPDLMRLDPAGLDKVLGAGRGSTTPAVNGRSLPLHHGERVLSGDIGPDGRLVLGTDYRLLIYRGGGQELATRRLASAAWAVAIARDRPLLVVAQGDGTIRWYSLREDLPLAELAGLFVAADGRRWTAWTAEGTFAHGDRGGAELVGYQQNGTTKAPTGSWLGLDQAYRLFHDPDAVRRVLQDPDSWPAIAGQRRAAALFADLGPPSLRLDAYCPLAEMPEDPASRGGLVAGAPAEASDAAEGCTPLTAPSPDAGGRGLTRTVGLPDASRAVKVRVAVTAGKHGLTAVDALVNGRNAGRVSLPPTEAPGTAGASVTVERVVPVAPGENNLVFRAYDRNGIASYSEPLLLKSANPPLPVLEAAGPAPVRTRTMHLLTVGVDAYEGITPLRYAVADARTFADTVREALPSAYGDLDETQLVDAEASRDGVVAAIARVARVARAEDAVLIYLSGHGIADEQGRYVYVTSDVTSAATAATAGLGGDQLLATLADIPAANVFLFLDTCYAGAFNLKGPANLANESGTYVLTASTSLQEALDSYDNRNGVLAFAVRDGLTGAASAGGAEPIDALQLGVHVRRMVPLLAAKRQHRQEAVFKAGGGDLREFPIAQPRD